MRILHIPEIAIPQAENSERMESLENVAKSLLQRLDSLEERLAALEKKRAMAKPAILEIMPDITVPSEPVRPVTTPEPEPAPTPMVMALPPTHSVTVDSELIKKGVLDKMWKYLNDDDRPAKAV